MIKSIPVHWIGGTGYFGLPYSECTASEGVQMVTERKYVTCHNCIKTLEKKEYKLGLRKRAEDEIGQLGKVMNSENWRTIQKAANKIWREYEQEVL